MVVGLPRVLLVLLALCALPVALAGCGARSTADAGGTITASVLIEPSPGEAHWARDVELPEGANAYDLLLAATDGQVESEFRVEFQSHLVQSIRGASAHDNTFWSVFLWNEERDSWEPLPVGADLFTVDQGHIMAWALVNFDLPGPWVPQATP